ncbi:hypothetical protein Aglo01_54920 [Actinokineospora globicatena]|nr:hypothetical protein Aglo01_54920 [Actinokineospora globicatena]GLW88204.1 hypothetical protein Aglo02_58430 [Actinokineospora globicatena]
MVGQLAFPVRPHDDLRIWADPVLIREGDDVFEGSLGGHPGIADDERAVSPTGVAARCPEAPFPKTAAYLRWPRVGTNCL